MKISKISNSEFSQNSIASLPIRPNESSKYGKAALSGEELKSMFDKNTELLRNRINSIIDYISGQGEYGIGSEISTGIPDLPTLKELCEGILDGSLAATLTLTEEYTLLDFATKLISLVHPDSAVEFIKIEEKDGAFTLPSVPYEGHESAIYLLPSSDSLSLFDCYTWDEGWQIWSTGSLQKYISELEEMLEGLRATAASKTEVNYLRLYKADDYDVNNLKMKLDSLCAGAPIVYNSGFSSLVYDENADLSRIYVITKKGDEAFGYWCYHDGATWQKGGTYISTTGIMGSVRKYSDLPASCRAIKAYVDEVIYDSLDHFAISYTGSENMFDKSAVETGKIESDGSITYDSSYVTTDYMDITAVFDFFCSCTSSSDVPRTTLNPSGLMFYKFDKTPYTSSYRFSEANDIECPITINRTSYPLAAYVRITFNNAIFHQVSKIMINSGKKVQSYTPYFEYRLDIDSEMNKTSTLPVTNKAICNYVEKKARRVGFVFGDGCDYPVFDTKNNKLIFNKGKSDGEWGIVLDGVTYHLESASSLEIDISPAMTLTSSGTESDRGIVYLNTTMLASQPTANQSRASCFFVRDADFATTDIGALPIASFKRSGSGFSAWMNCPFFIDDKLFGIAKDTDELFAKLGECESHLTEMDERTESALQTALGLETQILSLSAGHEELKERVDGIDSSVQAIDESLQYLDMNFGEAINTLQNDITTVTDFITATDSYIINSSNGLINYSANKKYIIKNIPLTNGVPILSMTFDPDSMSLYFSGELYIPKQSIAPMLQYEEWGLVPTYYGGDCSNGVFTPRANVEYLIKFSYFSRVYGEVNIISE